MLELVFRLYDKSKELVNQNIPLSQIKATGIFETLIRVKYEIPNDQLGLFDKYTAMVDEAIDTVQAAYA
jgi:V/A-type H+-transporting ATPase subunit A